MYEGENTTPFCLPEAFPLYELHCTLVQTPLHRHVLIFGIQLSCSANMKREYEHLLIVFEACFFQILPFSVLLKCISQEEEVGSCKQISSRVREMWSPRTLTYQNHHLVSVGSNAAKWCLLHLSTEIGKILYRWMWNQAFWSQKGLNADLNFVIISTANGRGC